MRLVFIVFILLPSPLISLGSMTSGRCESQCLNELLQKDLFLFMTTVIVFKYNVLEVFSDISVVFPSNLSGTQGRAF